MSCLIPKSCSLLGLILVKAHLVLRGVAVERTACGRGTAGSTTDCCFQRNNVRQGKQVWLFFFFPQALALKKWCADSSQAMPSANEENLMQITILCLRVSGPDYV